MVLASGSILRLYSALWTYGRGHRVRIVAFLVMLVLAQCIRLTIPWFFGLAVDAMQREGVEGIRQASKYLLAMLAAVGVAWVLHGPARVLERFNALLVRERFANVLHRSVLSLPVSWHQTHHSGETLHRITRAATALSTFAGNQYIYLQSLVSVLGPIAALWLMSWMTGLSAMVGYVVIAAFVIRMDVVMVRLVREENQAERRYHAALVDGLGNVATLTTLRLQQPTLKKIAGRLQVVFAPIRRHIVFNELKWAGVDFFNNAFRTGLVALFAWLDWRAHGRIGVGMAVAVHQYSQQIGNTVATLAMHWTDLVRQKTEVAEVDDLVAESPSTQTELPVAVVPPGWKDIALSQVSYVHPNARSEEGALKEVSLTLRRGERVALVGESGAGKSSLLRILAGLASAQKAELRVDGVLQPLGAHLGSACMLLPQDPEVFESSVRENVTMGLPCTDEELAVACALSELDAMTVQLPAGLETVISERGLNLSGGQKQRLALARGLLAARNVSVLLLDEPTSSVDIKTEARIYDGVMARFSDACVVSSVHRLHLLSRFDKVVLMRHGRVVDVGTPQEVVGRHPAELKTAALLSDAGSEEAA